MRSSKSRSRSKPNRNRSMGNIINRVFDSSGPEGKVRGTPQQIIDKYNQLARDAQLSNDRVATENFQQHAEHYTRMLSEAQREQDQRREQQEREQQERRERDQNQNSDRRDQQRDDHRGDLLSGNDHGEAGKRDGQGVPDDVIDTKGDDSGLVETPEGKPSRPRRQRRPKQSQQKDDASQAPDAPEAAE